MEGKYLEDIMSFHICGATYWKSLVNFTGGTARWLVPVEQRDWQILF